MEDSADSWVHAHHMPDPIQYRDPRVLVGMPHKTKVLVMAWLQGTFKLTLDEAITRADELEKYLEVNQR